MKKNNKISIHQGYEPPADIQNVLSKYSNIKCHSGWHDLPSGWINLLDKYCALLNDVAIKNNFIIKITQIKSKYGGIRFYIASGIDEIFDIIYAMENESEKTCEVCGSIENIGKTSGWIRTLCEIHGKNDPYWEKI